LKFILKNACILSLVLLTAACTRFSSSTSASSSSASDSSPSSTPALSSPALGNPDAPQSDEFVGPFNSWLNAKTSFGAKGDGVTDDTQALQNALNALSADGQSPVLYIPSGTYVISSTLTVYGGIYLTVVGQDPATTIIQWKGATGGTVMHVDGTAYSRFDRLTLNAASSAAVALEQCGDGATIAGRQAYFDTGNEYMDDVFENATGCGLRAGECGNGASEGTVMRVQFLNDANGFATVNPNTLDWWIWQSTFVNDGVGAQNANSGAYHVYDSLFENSSVQDLKLYNMGNFDFRGNTSIKSAEFFGAGFYYTNGAPTMFENNRVITPQSSTGNNIWEGNAGATVLVDNTLTMDPSQPACSSANNWAGCLVTTDSSYGSDFFSIGNTYNVANALAPGLQGANSGNPYQIVPAGTAVTGFFLTRTLEQDDQIVPLSSINRAVPTMPGTAINYGRTIFDVSGNTSAAIQAAVNQAAALCGSKPVVHLPFGSYTVSSSIVIPANCDMQIIGDGGSTSLNWSGPTGGAVLDLKGPSEATVREMTLNGNANATNILIENADQPGSRVYMLETIIGQSLGANLFSDSLDYTYVISQDIGSASTATAPASTGIGIEVQGGAMAAAGNPQTGRTVIFGGSGGGNYVSASAFDGGGLMIQDYWNDSAAVGGINQTFATITDNAQFTLEGSSINLSGTNGPAVTINNFSGNATFLCNSIGNVVQVSGSGNGNVWVAGNTTTGPGPYPVMENDWLVNNATGTTAIFTSNRNQITASTNGNLPNPDSGTPTAAFVRQMLGQDRASRFTTITDLTGGVTDVKIYRIFSNVGMYGIHIQH
jgi:Pectate lyase superfamily protein